MGFNLPYFVAGSGNQGHIKQMSSNEYFVPMGGTAGAQSGNYSANPNVFGTPQQHQSYSVGSTGFYPNAGPNRHQPQNFYANMPRAQFSADYKSEPVW